ncbi:MAG TPA: carboxylesterase family protein [bacterium]|nr:carboxylesterase family protein [bacterium]
MMRSMMVLAAAMLCLGAATARAQDLCGEPVATESGLVRGAAEADSATCVWRGIPFAAAPVGELRWRSPRPHPAWSGVRGATKWGARCMQKGIMELVNADPSKRMSEDCLFLNVWRPAKSGSFPVMVWIHGGGYVGGTGNSEFYWGDRLAETGDVVVVTFNYRLDLFGFFALPALKDEDPNGAAGGQGSLDQVAAIKWVHDNIRNFGGDPDNVTIFGESAGGASICTMVATPLTRGLFHRAIMESGGCDDGPPLEKGYASAQAGAQKVGCDPADLACLRRIPAKVLLDQAAADMMDGMSRPCADGWLLQDTALNMIRSGDYSRVPFMAGYNHDEGAALLKLVRSFDRVKPAQYEERLVQMGLSPEDAAELARLYPLAEFDNRPVLAYGRMFGLDTFFGCGTYDGLMETTARQSNVYFYRFDYADFRFTRYAGVAHAMEMPYVFNSTDRAPVSPLYSKQQRERAKEMVRVVQGYWLNFARTGDPNGPGLPEWPAFTTDDQRVQALDKVTRPEPITPLPERCAFWSELEKKGKMPGLGDVLK